MGKSIIECVPNISEGRDLKKINRIVDAARIPGALVDVRVGTAAAARAGRGKPA